MTETSMENSTSSETFMYFAYGSNLLSKRILIQNPTAKRRTSGKLKFCFRFNYFVSLNNFSYMKIGLQNYKLDFLTYSENWNGSSATIVEKDGSNVWGAVWEIDISNMKDLDRQEGVERNLYKVVTKSIETSTGKQITCRIYQQVIDPNESVEFEDIPIDRRPSKTYLNCILLGAEESELPIEYINDLKKIPHNNRDASIGMLKQLGWE